MTISPCLSVYLPFVCSLRQRGVYETLGDSELSNWVEQRGLADVVSNFRGALDSLAENSVFVRLSIAELAVAGSLGNALLR